MGLFLIARIAGRDVAIETGQVESVVELGSIIAVPRADRSVRGLAALRSRVVTVIDTGVALGLPPIDIRTARGVITRIDGHHYAILVDSLDDVCVFERLPLSTGLALGGRWAAAGTGIVERDGFPLLVIDLAALVPQMAAAA